MNASHILVRICIKQLGDLVSVCSKDIVLAATKVGADLTRKKGVFGDVCMTGVLIEGQDEEPCYADNDA